MINISKVAGVDTLLLANLQSQKDGKLCQGFYSCTNLFVQIPSTTNIPGSASPPHEKWEKGEVFNTSHRLRTWSHVYIKA